MPVFDFSPLKRLKLSTKSVSGPSFHKSELGPTVSMTRLFRNFASHGKDTIKATWSTYAPDSTIPGLGHYSREKHGTMRIFWAFITLVCITCLIYNFATLTAKYFEYEKRTNIDMKFDMNPFPAVTVCSLNPYKMSEAKKVKELRTLMNALDAAVKTIKLPTNAIKQAGLTEINKLNESQKSTKNTTRSEAEIILSNILSPRGSPALKSRRRRQADLPVVTMCSCELHNDDTETCRRDLSLPGDMILCVCKEDICQSCPDVSSCKFRDNPPPEDGKMDNGISDTNMNVKETKVTVCKCDSGICKDLLSSGVTSVEGGVETCVCSNNFCQPCPDPANCYVQYTMLASTQQKTLPAKAGSLPTMLPKLVSTRDYKPGVIRPEPIASVTGVLGNDNKLMTMCFCDSECSRDVLGKPENELTLCLCLGQICIPCKNIHVKNGKYPENCINPEGPILTTNLFPRPIITTIPSIKPTKFVPTPKITSRKSTKLTLRQPTTKKKSPPNPAFQNIEDNALNYYTIITMCQCLQELCTEPDELYTDGLVPCICLEGYIEGVTEEEKCQKCIDVSNCEYALDVSTIIPSTTTSTSTTTTTTTSTTSTTTFTTSTPTTPLGQLSLISKSVSRLISKSTSEIGKLGSFVTREVRLFGYCGGFVSLVNHSVYVGVRYGI